MGWVQTGGNWVKQTGRDRSGAFSHPGGSAVPVVEPPAVPLNDYTQMLRDRPLDLFRKFAVSPPDAASYDPVVSTKPGFTPFASRSPVATDGTFSRFFQPFARPLDTDETFRHATVKRKIAWIKLEMSDPRRVGALAFKAVVPKDGDGPPPGHLPVWFLPWESRHLVEMTIPPRQNEDDDDPNDPKIFFTAAINGCSVFVRGDPRSPTVTHGGISQGQTPYGNNPSGFWRDLLRANLAADDQHGGRIAEINNKDYVNQTGRSGDAKTANTDRYLSWLKTLPSGPLTVDQVVPWGCVFGIRYGRLWSFYLQENAVVHTYKVVAKYSKEEITETKKTFGIKREVVREVSVRKLVKHETTVNRPVVLRDFFPGKGGMVNFIETWQKW